AQAENFLLERIRGSAPVFLGALARLSEAIFEAWIDQRYVDQQRIVGRPAPGAAAGGERAERVAVVAELPRNDPGPAAIAALEMNLPGELQRRLGRLGAAA